MAKAWRTEVLRVDREDRITRPRGGIQEAIIAALPGHAHPTMTARYGRGWDVKSLGAAVASIDYPGVE